MGEEALIHYWEWDGRRIRFTWVGKTAVTPSKVHALAFTPTDEMLLVGGEPGDGLLWLPGGGVEGGETPREALARELQEEAAATLHELVYLGAQRAEDSLGTSEYHSFYWCRITLAEKFVPQHEVKERRLVAPQDFLDTLFWGRADPKAALLLELALEQEQLHAQRGNIDEY